MDVRFLVDYYIKKQTPSFWFWSIIAGAMGLMLLVLTAKIFLAGGSLNRHALDAGQRVIVHVKSSETEGFPRHTVRATQSKTASAPQISSSALSEGAEGLAPAPLAAITAESEKGLIPIIGHDGTVPWKYYGRPYNNTAQKRPLVAVALTNLGLSKPLTTDVLTLPHTFTLGFCPYASDARDWARQARKQGFESLVDLPMETPDYPALSDPGPYGILASLSPNDKSARLHWVLSRFPGFVGVLAPQNEKLTADINSLRPVLTELAARGVLFIYLKTPENAPVADLAKSHQLTVLGADMVVDDILTPSGLDAKLQKLTDLAKAQGTAIGIAHSYPITQEALARWADTLAAQGVDLVPVSAIGLRVMQ